MSKHAKPVMSNARFNLLIAFMWILFSAMVLLSFFFRDHLNFFPDKLDAANDFVLNLLGIVVALPVFATFYFIASRLKKLRHDAYQAYLLMHQTLWSSLFPLGIAAAWGFGNLHAIHPNDSLGIAIVFAWYFGWLIRGLIGTSEIKSTE